MPSSAISQARRGTRAAGRNGGSEQGNSVRMAFRRIRDLIVRGHLAPGSRIVEADLASALGVSRTPIRGALHMLQRDGYIVAVSNDSKPRLAVAPLTKDDARELYLMVGALEGVAARHTETLPKGARTALADKLERWNNQLRKLAEAHEADPNYIFDYDTQFHRLIVEATAGTRLRAMHEAIKPQIERYSRLYASVIIDHLGESVQEHEAIIAAIAKGQGAVAEEAVRHNWHHGAERLCKVIVMFGERGRW
ncbi:MAG: GntR family transcriptional regulator [Terriglobales bacterium]